MPKWTMLSDIDCPDCLVTVLDDSRLVAGMTSTQAAVWVQSLHDTRCLSDKWRTGMSLRARIVDDAA